MPKDALTSQARHHFTRFDQVDRLCAAIEAEADLAFMHRVLALCSLPRTDPGNQLQYKRGNGPFALYMIAGAGNKLPYGPLPRLLMVWLCSEATCTRSRELLLGDSLSEFMQQLGMEPVGSSRTRLRNQMARLFNAAVSMVYENNRDKVTVNAQIADRTEFWWNVPQWSLQNRPTMVTSKPANGDGPGRCCSTSLGLDSASPF